MQRHSFTTRKSTFVIDPEYEFVKDLGFVGDHRHTIAVRHRSGEQYTITKINLNFQHFQSYYTKRCLREIRLLQHFRGHQNIICLYDMDIVFQPDGNFNNFYLYKKSMEADLHSIINSGQHLSDGHFQPLIYQTLCGLKYIHSANVIHHDLRSTNLLVNGDTSRLARDQVPWFIDGESEADFYSRNYAPETMMGSKDYSQSTANHLWGVGCILGELLGRKMFFRNRGSDRIHKIIDYLGTPSEDILCRLESVQAQDYIRSLPIKPRVPFFTLFPQANPLAIDLLSQLLCFDPEKRISCDEALHHPYLHVWHDPVDEPVCNSIFDFGFEEENKIDRMKELIINEVSSFREEVRAEARATGPIRRQDSPPIPR